MSAGEGAPPVLLAISLSFPAEARLGGHQRFFELSSISFLNRASLRRSRNAGPSSSEATENPALSPFRIHSMALSRSPRSSNDWPIAAIESAPGGGALRA